MKKFFVTGLFVCSVVILFAQEDDKQLSKRQEKKREKREKINELIKLEDEGVPTFHKQNVFGAKLNTDGWGVSYEFGRAKTTRLAMLYQFEFNDKRHRKEARASQGIPAGGFMFFGNPFVYGKRNSFYQVKIAAGQQRLIGGKGNKNGVSVYGLYTGGVSLGMLRPYYLEVKSDGGNTTEYIKYDSPDSVKFMTLFDILGRGGLTKGWSDMKLAPGLHAKTAMRFDYNRFNTSISAIEAGVNVEYYFKEVEQMVYNPGRKLFVNAYISLLFGKRR